MLIYPAAHQKLDRAFVIAKHPIALVLLGHGRQGRLSAVTAQSFNKFKLFQPDEFRFARLLSGADSAAVITVNEYPPLQSPVTSDVVSTGEFADDSE